MRVLVTGGAGYIGSHCAHLLACRNHEVLIYDNLSSGHKFLAEPIELIVGDIRDRSTLLSALQRVDAVLHFAAHSNVGESVLNPRKYFDNNVTGGLNLLECVLDAGVRYIVFSSTCAVYGIPERVPIVEDTPALPINPYGVTKHIFEQALNAYDRTYGLRSVCLRYFNAAGADESGKRGETHDPESHLIPLALAAAGGYGKPLMIFGDDYATPDGTCIRDYIHVSDLAEAHVRALEYLTSGEPSAVLNLGTGRGHSVKEVIREIERVTGRQVPVKIGPRRAGDPAILVADPARARQVLGWTASRSLSEILQSAWNWMRGRAQSAYA